MKKNGFVFVGMLAIMLVFGLVLAACDNGTTTGGGGNPFVGTWRSPDGGGYYVLVFTEGSFTITSPSGDVERGIYSYASGDVSTEMLLNDGRRFNVSISGNSISFGSRTYTKS
jgi:hypothetical protein